MTPLEPTPPPLTELEGLRIANATKLRELAAQGVQIDLTPPLLGKLVDRVFGPSGSPERAAFDLDFEQSIASQLADVDRQVTEQRARAILLQPGPVPPSNGMGR